MKIKIISNYLKKKYIANAITLIRLILVIPIIFFLQYRNLKTVWILILIGALTDYFDGYFANKLNYKSKLGAIIDPLADKIFINIPLVWLCINGMVPFWSLSLIIFREFLISAFRGTKKNGMPAKRIGKYKTFFFFISIITLFFPFNFEFTFYFGLTFYWIGFLLSMVSIPIYLFSK